MKRLALEFVQPLCVEVQEDPVSEPADDQVLVRTEVPAISSGTEMLVFKGLVPADLAVDETLASLSGDCFAYPFDTATAAPATWSKPDQGSTPGGSAARCLPFIPDLFSVGAGRFQYRLLSTFRSFFPAPAQ